MNAWMAKQFDIFTGHFLASLFYRPGVLSRTDLSELQVYQGEELANDPSRFYFCPPDIPAVTVGESRSTSNYIYEQFSFPSSYWPLSDAFARRYETYVENHTVYGKRFRPKGRPSRATVLLLHGWTKGDYLWESRLLIPWMCRDFDYTVVALVHPYHSLRQPGESRFSGEFFISADMIRTLEAVRQSVIDTRATLNWLLAEGDEPVGVVGISLGAFITYLLLCADRRLDFAIPVMGHGDLIHSADNAAFLKNVRRDIQAQGLDIESTPNLTRAITAIEMRPQLSPERILPINGRYDMIVSPESARKLFEVWEIPEAAWLPGGHFSILHTWRFRRALQDFIEKRI